jgi:hypothetical protein
VNASLQPDRNLVRSTPQWLPLPGTASRPPTADLTVDPAATFTTDLPRSGPLSDGWRSDVVPTPYLARPAATIGLGDTFVAGLLLSDCLHPAENDTRNREMETNR